MLNTRFSYDTFYFLISIRLFLSHIDMDLKIIIYFTNGFSSYPYLKALMLKVGLVNPGGGQKFNISSFDNALLRGV